ncbi:hypothetical protein NQ317_014453 [Molorchus minor]|uniref:Nuclear RNA export factor 1 n=1 Tax=Molorchus minor TaxID=1323400 RepID=A0ABQ9J4S1_9CUCU|nr:hypothetical protein NQ317_014453 [Molorchus minor]
MSSMNMKPRNDAVVINEASLPTGIYYRNKHIVNNVNYWHKFIVHNTEGLSRASVLRTILNHVHPLDLIPVSFSNDKNTSSFLGRNCGAAIEKLCKDNLTIGISDSTDSNIHQSLKLTVILKFATTGEFKIDVQRNILSVLQKRYDGNSRKLDLTRFDEDPELSEFCPLSQPKIMFFILHTSKNLTPSPEGYILCHNQIKVLNPLEAVTSIKVTYLDLRNNLIENIDDIGLLSIFGLTDLLLDRNPLCNKLTELSYIKRIKACCKNIERVDEIALEEGIVPIAKTNSLCNPQGYDLVNQLGHYNMLSRNLLRLADFSRSCKSLYRGSYSIIQLFTKVLPATEHDPFSFNVDLIYYATKCAVIVVNGVFREMPQTLLEPEKLYGFTRTFVLEISSQNGECNIINEQLHVYNALTHQTISSFKFSRPIETNALPETPNQKEQQQLADTLKIITNLNTEWSKKCLEECKYNLNKALTLFVDLYKLDRIPPEAFIFNKKNSISSKFVDDSNEKNLSDLSGKPDTADGVPSLKSSFVEVSKNIFQPISQLVAKRIKRLNKNQASSSMLIHLC